jgi:hypothetical protein
MMPRGADSATTDMPGAASASEAPENLRNLRRDVLMVNSWRESVNLVLLFREFFSVLLHRRLTSRHAFGVRIFRG